jgi:hypothetical protein
MAYKLLVFVAAIPEKQLLDEGKFPAILETAGERVTLPPVVVCDIESGFDVAAAKNKLGESIDRLAKAVNPNREKPTQDPKIIAGRKMSGHKI